MQVKGVLDQTKDNSTHVAVTRNAAAEAATIRTISLVVNTKAQVAKPLVYNPKVCIPWCNPTSLASSVRINLLCKNWPLSRSMLKSNRLVTTFTLTFKVFIKIWLRKSLVSCLKALRLISCFSPKTKLTWLTSLRKFTTTWSNSSSILNSSWPSLKTKLLSNERRGWERPEAETQAISKMACSAPCVRCIVLG